MKILEKIYLFIISNIIAYSSKLLNLLRTRNKKVGLAKAINVPGNKTGNAQEEIILADTLDNIDAEISVNYLDDQLQFLKKQKEKISKRNQNKLGNQLDQLIMRGEARLRTLKSFNFEQLEMERLLVVQGQMKGKVESFKFFDSNIDFEQFREAERQLLDIDFTKNFPPSETIPVDFEYDLSRILKSLHIEEHDAISSAYNVSPLEISAPPIEEANDKNADNQEIIDYLKSFGVKWLYHVTHMNNSESINKDGLFSWENLEKNRIPYLNELTKDGLSQQLDRRKKKGNYVRLSFCKGSPMFYQKRYLQTNVIYRIDLEVLREADFEFSNINGADNLVEFGSSLKFLKERARISLTQKSYRNLEQGSMERKYYQAEVLIHKHVPSKYIIDCQLF